jgi:hypothetical protein
MHHEDSFPDEKQRSMVHCFSVLFFKFAGNEVARAWNECRAESKTFALLHIFRANDPGNAFLRG